MLQEIKHCEYIQSFAGIGEKNIPFMWMLSVDWPICGVKLAVQERASQPCIRSCTQGTPPCMLVYIGCCLCGTCDALFVEFFFFPLPFHVGILRTRIIKLWLHNWNINFDLEDFLSKDYGFTVRSVCLSWLFICCINSVKKVCWLIVFVSPQPMMGSMRALAAVIQQASAKHFVGSGVLNLLQSQVDSCFDYKKNTLWILAFLLYLLILKYLMPRLKQWLVITQWGHC